MARKQTRNVKKDREEADDFDYRKYGAEIFWGQCKDMPRLLALFESPNLLDIVFMYFLYVNYVQTPASIILRKCRYHKKERISMTAKFCNHCVNEHDRFIIVDIQGKVPLTKSWLVSFYIKRTPSLTVLRKGATNFREILSFRILLFYYYVILSTVAYVLRCKWCYHEVALPSTIFHLLYLAKCLGHCDEWLILWGVYVPATQHYSTVPDQQNKPIYFHI
jgi:hypothetical protein